MDKSTTKTTACSIFFRNNQVHRKLIILEDINNISK